MNSYPSEFLSHLRPVMFVAGLDGAPDPPPSDAEMSEDDRVLGKSVQSDAFASLTKRLREALQEKSVNKGTIWIGDAGRAEPGFKIVMVDKVGQIPLAMPHCVLIAVYIAECSLSASKGDRS